MIYSQDDRFDGSLFRLQDKKSNHLMLAVPDRHCDLPEQGRPADCEVESPGLIRWGVNLTT